MAGAALLLAVGAPAELVAVRHVEGVVHGFLALRALDGRTLADGDLIQSTRGNRVTSRLVFHFRDGSLHEETVVFSQSDSFRLISDHLVQKGPAFERAVDLSIDVGSGQVTVRYADEDGKEKVASERLDLPADLANGLIFTLLKNIRPETPQTTFSMVAATPKPRLIKLIVTPVGREVFSIGRSPRKAVKYVVKVEIGGLAGFMASLLGKTPPDSHVWILGGEAPAFVKSEGPLSIGGPLWRIELASPVW